MTTLNSAKAKPYKCSICEKRFPSPEAGSAHLTKRHEGGGYLSWFQIANLDLEKCDFKDGYGRPCMRIPNHGGAHKV